MTTFDVTKENDIINGINSIYDELMKNYTKMIEESLTVLLEENCIIVGDPVVLDQLRAAAPDKAKDMVYSEFVSSNLVLVVKKIAISSENLWR